MSDNTPGWQPDPTGQHDHRYWDGTQWTENVADAGVAGIDPLEDAAPWARAEPEVPTEPEVPADLDEPTVVDQEAPAPDATADDPATVEQPAAWPTDPAAPGAPAPPPPYVPGEPAGEGGSKKGLLIGGGILAAVVLAVIAFMALGGDDDESSVQAQLASKLEEEADGDLTSDQADCVAGLLIDEVGEDAFKDVDFDAKEAPDEVLNAFLAVGAQTMADECDIDDAGLTGTTDSTDDTTETTEGSATEGSYGSDPDLDELYDACAEGDYASCDQLYLDSPSDSEYETFGDTCGDRNEPGGFCVDLYGEGGESTDGAADGSDLPADFEQNLADTYESTLGLSSGQAECLAKKLTEVIEEGTLSEEEAASDFMSYLSDCDIDLEDISGN